MTYDKRLKETDQARYQLLCKVAWLYYQDELTQAEIADKLGVSRVTVNRLIKEARESGVVEIKVRTDLSASFRLAQDLCQEFQIRDAIVIPPAVEGENLQVLLARAAAGVLDQRLEDGITVGVGIGRTISYIPDYLHPAAPVACRFIGLTGGVDLRQEGVPHTFDTISRLANLTGGRAIYIPTPSYLTDASIQKLLMEEQTVVSALEIAAGSQLAVFSVGAADYSALLYQYHLITSQELEELHRQKVVGDMLGRFFDSRGRELEIELNERILGLHLEQLKRIPLKILAAAGENKRAAILIALQSSFCDILVTDTTTAEWLNAIKT